MARGFDRPLYILPFDHRDSFQTRLFGWKSPLNDAQTSEIAGAKQVIYDGFQSELGAGVPSDKAGILVDEQFGAAVLRDAPKGIVTACPAEKSGQQVPGFIGFAVGRTVFWDALVALRAGKATREQAVAQIAGRYREFVDLFDKHGRPSPGTA